MYENNSYLKLVNLIKELKDGGKKKTKKITSYMKQLLKRFDVMIEQHESTATDLKIINDKLTEVINKQDYLSNKINHLLHPNKDEEEPENPINERYKNLKNTFYSYDQGRGFYIDLPYFHVDGTTYKLSNRYGREKLMKIGMECIDAEVAFIEEHGVNYQDYNLPAIITCPNCRFKEVCNIFKDTSERANTLFIIECLDGYRRFQVEIARNQILYNSDNEDDQEEPDTTSEERYVNV